MEGVDIVIGAQDKASSVLASISGKVNSLASSFNPATLAMGAATAGIAAVTAGLAVMSAGVLDAANKIDELNDRAAGLGISVGELQAFAFALQVAGGISTEKSIDSLQKLQRIIGDIATGGNDAGATIFARLELDAERLAQSSPVEQFKAIQNALAAIENRAERAATAQQLFGKSAAELLPALSMNSEELRAQEEYAKAVNAAVSNEGAAAIGSMNDALDKVTLGFQGLLNTLAIDLAPLIETTALALAEWIPPIVDFAEDTIPGLVEEFVYLNGVLKDIFNTASSLATLNFEGVNAALTADSGNRNVEELQESRRQASIRARIELERQAAERLSELTQRNDEKAEAAADKAKAAADATIAQLQRKLSVEQLGEDAVRRQEELASATNDAERERIALLQEQIAAQEKKNALADENLKKFDEQIKIANEASKKRQEEAQAKAEALSRPAAVNVAVESRFLTRGNSDQAIDRVAKASESSKTLLEQIKEVLLNPPDSDAIKLELVS